MGQPAWGKRVDTTTPSPARVYDYFLGGSHNFDIDRQMAASLQSAMHDIGEIMRANRSFLRRAVSYLTSIGIRQFLDLGSGIPTIGNVHQVARRIAPDARVVYVDIDPVAVEHSLAVLDGDPLTAVVQADLRDPDRVLNAQETVKLLDFRQPVALLLLGVLHQVVAVDPVSMIGGYRQAMAEGSHLALSHASQDHRPQEARAFERTYNKEYTADVSMTLRSRDEVLALFGGFELVEPGLVQLPEWRPDERDTPEERPERFSTYAGVGRLASVIHG